jgi:hypothetical protein
MPAAPVARSKSSAAARRGSMFISVLPVAAVVDAG